MSYSNLESALTEATKNFDQVAVRRERLIKDSRDVIALSAKAIILVHSSNFSEARKLRREAKTHLVELRKLAGSDLARYLITPEQEFVESSVIYAVAMKESLPSRKQLRVSPSSYVLGLLDSVGELKRSTYDSIRQNDFARAERMFSVMERLYLVLSPFAIYDNITQGIKRKLDVARMLIEDTRATITEEARRREFVSAVNDLSAKLGYGKLMTTARKTTEESQKYAEGEPPQEESES
jgi:translin